MSGDMSERDYSAPDYLPQFNLKSLNNPVHSGQFATNKARRPAANDERASTSPIPTNILRAILDYWLANGVPYTTPLPQLKNQILEYYLEFKVWPGPVSFASVNARVGRALPASSYSQEQETAQLIMARALLPTHKIADLDLEEVSSGTTEQNQENSVASNNQIQNTPAKPKRSLKRTGYDYMDSEYGEAARKLLADRPGLARYLGVNAEKLLAIILAWCNHVLFNGLGGREGRYMSLGLDRFAREAGLTTRSVQVALKALQQAQLIETTLAGLALGQTEATKRIPIPADELFALKADCQRLTMEQGGGPQGYLQPRCWQFHKEANAGKSKSTATGNVFYILKQDVWEAEIVRELRPFNPFQSLALATHSPELTLGNVLPLQAGSQTSSEAKKRTTASQHVPPVAATREKDVISTERTLPSSSNASGKDVTMEENETNKATKGRFNPLMREKYARKDVKRTSLDFPTSTSRPHESVLYFENEYINTFSIKAKINPVQVEETLPHSIELIPSSNPQIEHGISRLAHEQQPAEVLENEPSTVYTSYPRTSQNEAEAGMVEEDWANYPEKISSKAGETNKPAAPETTADVGQAANSNSSPAVTPTKRKQYFSQLSATEQLGAALLATAHLQMPDYSGDAMDWGSCVQFAQKYSPQVLAHHIADVARLKASLVNAPKPIKRPMGFLRNRLARLAPSMLNGAPIEAQTNSGQEQASCLPSEAEQALLDKLAAEYYKQSPTAAQYEQGQKAGLEQLDITEKNKSSRPILPVEQTLKNTATQTGVRTGNYNQFIPRGNNYGNPKQKPAAYPARNGSGNGNGRTNLAGHGKAAAGALNFCYLSDEDGDGDEPAQASAGATSGDANSRPR